MLDLVCPRCQSKVNELVECDNCGTIGCIRCIKKSYGKWICFKCEPHTETQEIVYSDMEKYDRDEEEKISDAFSAMFG
jgi:methionyl-tRNA synthetase